MALLAAASAVAGRAGLDTMLTPAFLLQVIPSMVTAYRTARPSGIAAGTWLLILGELSCWTIFGLHELDPRLITLGLTGVTASILMLARLRYANRLRGPLTVNRGVTSSSVTLDSRFAADVEWVRAELLDQA